MLLDAIKIAVKNYIPVAGNKIKRIDHVNANDTIISALYYSDWGIPKPYLGTVLPEGYVWCNIPNQTVLRSDCHTNFISVMQGPYPGNGSTTLDIPYIKPGSSLIQDGTDTTSGITFTQGNDGGEVNHTLTESELASHTHIQNPHNHRIYTYEGAGNGVIAQDNNEYSESQYYNTSSTQATNQAAGGGQPHNNMSPYFVVKYILRIK